ncbi:MAG: ABC-F family ATP-binding cassette domain-containing protein, partial [Lachnospiraceae bacterium]|nr:ABC-F family ATP-binding cassette domain-containing protein [Lachnospiraceae bacterium]
KDLSGGERGRLSLAKLMLSNANFLILDEPTNHLDIVSREILENALNNYSGTVLYVSHDRYFINKTCTCVKELYNGHLLSCEGNYDYFIEKRDDLIRALDADPDSDITASENTKSDSSTALDYEAQKAQKNAIRKRENLIKKCEEEIEKTEGDIALIKEQMSDPSLASDFVKLNELTTSLTALESHLEELMEEWEALSE